MKKYFIYYLLFSISLFSKPLEVGSEWNLLEFTDQNEKKVNVTQETSSIFFVSDMDASKIVHEVLQAETEESLQKKKLIFISDIHRMPSLITRFIALPKMRGYSYPMALVREKDISNDIPREKGKVSVIALQKFKIVKIDFISTKEELQKFVPILK
jgi:hypothetical protein